MPDKYTIDELIEKSSEILEDAKYHLSKTKVPQKRRTIQHAIAFWNAMNEHLNIYRSLLKDSTID